MSGPLRQWTQFPVEPALGDSSKQCLDWLVTTMQQIQPALFPPQQPTVTTISHPNAVQLVWNEVQGAVSYACYENATAAAPPGVPFATVPANIGAVSNSILRTSINDTVTRFYSVIAIGQNNRSLVSTSVPGVALSGGSTVIPASQNPVNQGGVGGGVGGGGGLHGIIGRRSQF